MNKDKAIELLTKIFDLELNGIIRYTHYSLMVFGPNRIPLVEFFRNKLIRQMEQKINFCIK